LKNGLRSTGNSVSGSRHEVKSKVSNDAGLKISVSPDVPGTGRRRGAAAAENLGGIDLRYRWNDFGLYSPEYFRLKPLWVG